MAPPIRIFLSYAREDLEQVKEIYQRLSAEGFHPWMDVSDLYGGEDWQNAIFKALEKADFVLIFLSTRSYKRGFLRREIRRALYIAKEKLESDIYLIPVRLEKCEVEQSLRRYHWVNFFEVDGWDKLLEAIREGSKRRYP